jgi:hypothetical protein
MRGVRLEDELPDARDTAANRWLLALRVDKMLVVANYTALLHMRRKVLCDAAPAAHRAHPQQPKR